MQAVSRALIPHWVVVEILLVVILCIIPGSSRLNLGDNGLAFWCKMLLLNSLRHLFGDLELFIGMGVDAGPVLGSLIISLPVLRRWVVSAVKMLNERGIRHL